MKKELRRRTHGKQAAAICRGSALPAFGARTSRTRMLGAYGYHEGPESKMGSFRVFFIRVP